MISRSFMPSVLMMAISTVMLGCGGGGSGGDSGSSNGGGTENPNNGNTNPKPVTCAENRIAIKRIEGKQEERAIKLFTSRLLTGTFTAMVAVAVMAVSHIIEVSA